MAVLFPTQFGQILQPNRPAELLQGFLNIQNAENVRNGELTKANLVSYSQKQFFAVDSNGSVAGYLNNNFAAIAGLDGNANSISTNDLVQLRSNLPPVQQPPVYPPVQGNGQQPPLFNLMTQLLQMMLQLFSGLFR